jgi:hypothetical protein
MSFARAAVVAIAALQFSFEPQTGGTPMIGVVEVPKLLQVYSPTTGEPLAPTGVRIPLRAQPAGESPVVATVTKREDLATVEYMYEEAAAIVHPRQGSWCQVRTSGGVAGWIAAADAGNFLSLEELFDEHMAYLTHAWDGRLFAGPGAADRVLVPDDPDRRLAGYLEPDVPNVAPGVVVPLFETQNSVTSVASVQTNRADEVLQTTHQIPHQVIVLETRPGWYQVARANHDGEWRSAARLWVQAFPVWRFRPVAEGQPMTALAERVWGPESRDVRVTGMRTVGDRLWVEVELITGHDCGAVGAGMVRARGWIPAHAPSGDLNVWYYPRGC